MVRKAKIKDVKSIHKILTHYANKALVLPRSLSEIYDHLRDFYVIESHEAQGSILAVGALNISWEDLGEIRSLAVCEDSQKNGLGSSIVEACLKEANELGLKQVFALTMIKEFFARFGFKEVDKSLLPHKIWADCVKCPNFPDCNEIAMILAL
jgi:amino-acid N-acetyltransferase